MKKTIKEKIKQDKKKYKNIIDLSSIPKGVILHSVTIQFTDLHKMGGTTMSFPVPAKTAQTKGRIRFIDEIK